MVGLSSRDKWPTDSFSCRPTESRHQTLVETVPHERADRFSCTSMLSSTKPLNKMLGEANEK